MPRQIFSPQARGLLWGEVEATPLLGHVDPGGASASTLTGDSLVHWRRPSVASSVLSDRAIIIKPPGYRPGRSLAGCVAGSRIRGTESPDAWFGGGASRHQFLKGRLPPQLPIHYRPRRCWQPASCLCGLHEFSTRPLEAFSPRSARRNDGTIIKDEASAGSITTSTQEGRHRAGFLWATGQIAIMFTRPRRQRRQTGTAFAGWARHGQPRRVGLPLRTFIMAIVARRWKSQDYRLGSRRPKNQRPP